MSVNPTIYDLADKDASKFMKSLSYRGAGDWRSPSGEAFDEEDMRELRAKRAAHLTDTLERIDREWRSLGLACDCGVPGESCQICKITDLLDEFKLD